MSFINFGLVNPRLVYTLDADTGSTPLGGLLYRPHDQALYTSNGGTIARRLNGLPLTAAGRLVVSLANGVVQRYKDGLAFNALGQLLMTDTFPVARFVHGWPVDSEGRICVFEAIPATSFNLPLDGSLIPISGGGSLVPTFVRATTGYETDFEGVLRQAAIGEARFTGYRRVRNYLPKSEAFEDADWLKLNSGTGAVPVVTPGFTGPTGAANARRVQFDLGATPTTAISRLFTQLGYSIPPNRIDRSIWVKSNTINNQTIYFGGYALALITATPTWRRITVDDLVDTTGYEQIQFGLDGSQSTDTTAAILVFGAQFEVVTGQSNQAPGEYVSVGVLAAPWHGAGIDGVKKDFLTTNGNSVVGNVVIEATGTPIPAATRKKYLSEGQRTNQCGYSQKFDEVVAWSTNMVVAPDQIAAPDGTITADAIFEQALVSVHNIYQGQNFTAVPHTFSFYAKYLGRQWIAGRVDDGITVNPTYFDIQNGVVGNLGAASNATINSLGNGWFRCSLTLTPLAATWYIVVNSVLGNGMFGNFLGDITKGVYLWGAQVEAAPFASSYIPTTTAAVTRNAKRWPSVSTAMCTFEPFFFLAPS